MTFLGGGRDCAERLNASEVADDGDINWPSIVEFDTYIDIISQATGSLT